MEELLFLQKEKERLQTQIQELRAQNHDEKNDHSFLLPPTIAESTQNFLKTQSALQKDLKSKSNDENLFIQLNSRSDNSIAQALFFCVCLVVWFAFTLTSIIIVSLTWNSFIHTCDMTRGVGMFSLFVGPLCLFFGGLLFSKTLSITQNRERICLLICIITVLLLLLILVFVALAKEAAVCSDLLLFRLNIAYSAISLIVIICVLWYVYSLEYVATKKKALDTEIDKYFLLTKNKKTLGTDLRDANNFFSTFIDVVIFLPSSSFSSSFSPSSSHSSTAFSSLLESLEKFSWQNGEEQERITDQNRYVFLPSTLSTVSSASSPSLSSSISLCSSSLSSFLPSTLVSLIISYASPASGNKLFTVETHIENQELSLRANFILQPTSVGEKTIAKCVKMCEQAGGVLVALDVNCEFHTEVLTEYREYQLDYVQRPEHVLVIGVLFYGFSSEENNDTILNKMQQWNAAIWGEDKKGEDPLSKKPHRLLFGLVSVSSSSGPPSLDSSGPPSLDASITISSSPSHVLTLPRCVQEGYAVGTAEEFLALLTSLIQY